ncbi:MAG: MlaD family protein [Nitriliruptorales bacterium]
MSGERPLLMFVGFGIICLVFAVWLVVTIGNIDLFANRVAYEAVLGDVTGLVENDEVKVAGVKVGKVDRIAVERGNAVVTFSVDEGLALGRDTVVGVRWRNLLGLRYLYVYPQGDDEHEPGYRFPLERSVSIVDFGRLMQRLVPIQRALEPEVGNVVVRSLNDALVGREERIQQLIANAGQLTNTLADREQEIAGILREAARLAGAYAEREQALREFIDNFASVADTVAARNDELERIVVDLAEAQQELARFLDANDEVIQGAIDGLDGVTSVMALNRANFEDLVTHLGRGLVFYHRTSRWGQWFNVRVVGLSDGGETVTAERGAELPPERRGREDDRGASGFLRAGLRGSPAGGGG